MDFFTDCEVAPIFLAQSDTTAGFLCADFVKLNAIKGRLKSQNTLLTLDSFCKLKNLVRIPEKYKNRVRRSTKNTFIYSGKHALSREGSENTKLAIRVIKPHRLQETSHADFLRFFPFLYSSSANAHHQMFHLDFALQKADMVILDKRGLAESQPSKIYKISNFNLKCIR
ncbi:MULTISPECIES: hypothetical protein [Helicobacter]|uniref:Sua5 YciO YrdC YwlC family protein n=1 Tax=Helicobacter ganmani TaxID=60246 RepID=A0A3D8IFW4_9HELI|nr:MULTISPECIES: hypothetical protein [Helicobacter]RDU63796.1 hypothetical protein CQA43_02950 [Helicobacter ganmani]